MTGFSTLGRSGFEEWESLIRTGSFILLIPLIFISERWRGAVTGSSQAGISILWAPVFFLKEYHICTSNPV